MGRVVDLAGGGCAYLAGPDQGAGLGLLVIPEHQGLGPHIEDVCDRFAAEGFTALAPDLSHGAASGEPDGKGTVVTAHDVERGARELEAAVEHLAGSSSVRGEGMGVVGFGTGAGLAFVIAADRPHDIRAGVVFYGLVPSEWVGPNWSRLQAPVQGHFAEHDRLVPPEEVRRLEATLGGMGKDVELFVYPDAAHAFFDDTRPDAYHPTAAGLAWTRTLEFLRAKLG